MSGALLAGCVVQPSGEIVYDCKIHDRHIKEAISLWDDLVWDMPETMNVSSKSAIERKYSPAELQAMSADDMEAVDRKSTRLNSSHSAKSRMPSSA